MKKLAAFIIIFCSILTFTLAAYKTFDAMLHPIKYSNAIITYSQKYNLSAALVASVINVESSYNPNSKSSKNAIGLMQIKLSTANYLNQLSKESEIDEKSLFKIDNNIKYGCMYLNYLQKKFENTFTVIAAYNAGETNVRSWLNDEKYSSDKKTLKNIPFLETKKYIEKIKKNLKFYQKYYNF